MQNVIFLLVIVGISAVILRFELVLFRRGRSLWGARPSFVWGSVLFWLYAGNAKLPFLALLFGSRDSALFRAEGILAVWYFAVLAWVYPMFLFGLVHLLATLAGALLARVRAALHTLRAEGESTGLGASPGAEVPGHPRSSRGEPVAQELMSRSDLLTNALCVLPFAAHVSLFGAMIHGSRGFQTNRLKLTIPELPEDLRGFRIVQISDLHVGVIVSGSYLHLLADVLRSLRADLLLVTGDILDNSNAFLSEAGRFFRTLDGRYSGMLGVLGNHDYIHDAAPVYRHLPASGLELLRNRVVRVRRGNGVLQVMGMDYPGRRMGNAGDRLRLARAYYRQTAAQLRPDEPRILLNHHPSDFAFLRKEPIDLVLSGHTHGGQISFSTDRQSPLSPASLFFPYYRGLYQGERSRLYVNCGVGHWLPLRVNTPPEITVFELERT